MKTRFLGGSLAALLLALALAGCGGKTGTGTGTTDVSGAPPVGSASDTLATVGTSQVTRGQLNTLLEGIAGVRVLPELIDGQLLTEALKAKGGQVSDDEITAEVNRVAQYDPAIKAATDAGGARAQVPREQVRRNLTVQKLLTEGIAADDAKVQAFFNQYASYYGTPAQNKLGLLAASTKTRADQLARALQTKPDSFAALVAEQQKTNDQVARGLSNAGDGPTARFETPDEFGAARLPPQVLPQIGPALAPITKALETAKKGQVLPVLALTPRGPFLIVKVIDRKDATKPAFATLKDQATLDYKLAQVAQVEIKKNPTNPPKLEDNIKRTAEGLKQQLPPGQRLTLRDVLTYILQPASQNQIKDLRSKGNVQISDPAYKDVAQAYAPAPAAATAGNTATGTAPATNSATNSAAPATNSASPATNSASPATNSAAPATNSAAPATNSAAPAKR